MVFYKRREIFSGKSSLFIKQQLFFIHKLQRSIEYLSQKRSERDEMSFITIHFGDDQKLFFNLLCPTIILYENIKLRCGCEKKVVIDIADENGSLKILSERPPYQYASEYIQGRGNYVLLKVLKKADSLSGKEFSTFEPLLNNVSEMYPYLMSKVHSNKINPDVGLPVQSFTLSPQKSSVQTRTKPNPRGSTKPRSPAQGAGSIAGGALPSVPKMKSSARLSREL